ncbi:MAG: phytoene desaturase family protein [Chitinophagaceae bacterium]|jgi:phytoene desaturase|nr:phytoene desaturase family protein [Chitinophagaceae bacterium]
MSSQKKAVVIGSGFAGMSAASFLARAGWQVTVAEQHTMPGGRARRMQVEGFSFDMGPSWYWMPDVFERYFGCFGKKVSDYYHLIRLDPSYRVYWPDDHWDIPASYEAFGQMLESVEPGAARALDKVMEEAAYKYEVGINKLVFKPGQSVLEFLDADLVKGIFRLDVFNSIKKHFGKHFRHPKIRELMEFPALFLGALPEDTPALYSLMNYADIKGGTWFPEGGMYKIAEAMHELAGSLGVQFLFGHAATGIEVRGGKAAGVHTRNQSGEAVFLEADVVVSGADYHFTETKLLDPQFRSYTSNYWNSRVMAPSCLLYYVGLNKKIPGLKHHALFFDTAFQPHARDIYTTPRWPDDPLFYVSATSVTDPSQAPDNAENLFFLIPVASGLQGDDEALRERYFNQIVDRFEKRLGTQIRDHIVYYRSFSVSDFVSDYNAFKGNAYGLANTLLQTAILKPSARSRKVPNLFYTGQLTVPGPGVPPSLISGEVVASLINRNF